MSPVRGHLGSVRGALGAQIPEPPPLGIRICHPPRMSLCLSPGHHGPRAFTGANDGLTGRVAELDVTALRFIQDSYNSLREGHFPAPSP